VLDVAETANAPERVKEYADASLAQRVAQGVGMAPKERRNFELYALDAIGCMPLCASRAVPRRHCSDAAGRRARDEAGHAHVLSGPAEGTQLAPNPGDPSYFETSTTLPVDFHSFRRPFNAALAAAGHAMHLVDHSDPKVHPRYVMHAFGRSLSLEAPSQLALSSPKLTRGRG
jgi:hypothetical protein